MDELKLEKEKKVSQQLFEDAAVIRDKEKKLILKLNKAQNVWQKEEEKTFSKIGYDNIADIVSVITGIPIAKIAESESNKLLNLNNELGKSIIGQRNAINSLTNAIKRSRSGLKDPNRPIGVFLFLGPTGVGKTQLAKSLAKYLFSHDSGLIKIDMSEYTERFSMSRLIGSPPGYVGYDEGGELTEKVRRNPYSVVLFDEIEKGHADLYNMLLQVFDEGVLTDSMGRKIDFKNTILIMTSNIGSKNLDKDEFGFFKDDKKKDHKRMENNILKFVQSMFSPELLNRIDETIVFNALSKDNIYNILDLQLYDLIRNLQELGIKIIVYKSAKNFILKTGYNINYGVRFLRRTIQTRIENPISEILLKNKVSEGETILVKSLKNEIVIDIKSEVTSKK